MKRDKDGNWRRNDGTLAFGTKPAIKQHITHAPGRPRKPLSMDPEVNKRREQLRAAQATWQAKRKETR